MAHFTSARYKSQWQWTMMIRRPDLIAEDDINGALDAAAKKKSPPDTSGLRLHAEIERAGHQLSGKHHEIYLSDIHRAAPEKRRTILRQPFTAT